MQQNRDSNISVLYDKYADMLYRISRSILLSNEDAQDTIQEVFTIYITKLPTHKDEEHEKAWFIKVTINKCRDLQRKRKLRSYVSLDSVLEPVCEEAKTDSIYDDVITLPEKYKIVILLHYYESMSVLEIAKTLHVSPSSIKMRLLRGRNLLKEKLKAKEKEND